MKKTYPEYWDDKAYRNWREWMESLDPAEDPEGVAAYKEHIKELKMEGYTLCESTDEVSESQQIFEKIARESKGENSEASHLFLKIAREEMQRYKTVRNLVEAESENGLDKEESAWLLRIIQRRINYALDLIELERA